jgi:hypothetical protein
MKTSDLIWYIALLCASPASADSALRTVLFSPQHAVIGAGTFCGTMTRGVLLQDLATGDAYLADADDFELRVRIALPVPSGGVRTEITRVVDVNGDGCSELLVRDPMQSRFELWFLEGPRVIERSTIPISDFSNTIVVEGIGDESTGLFLRNRVSGELTSYVFSGRSWARSTLNRPGENVGLEPVSIADFDGTDGSDVLWRNTFSGEFAFSHSDNGLLSSPQTIELGGSGFPGRLVGVHDFNADRSPELIFYRPNGAPHGNVVVLGYDIRLGFIADEGYSEKMNEALRSFLQSQSANGDWKMTVIADPDGITAPSLALSFRHGLP